MNRSRSRFAALLLVLCLVLLGIGPAGAQSPSIDASDTVSTSGSENSVEFVPGEDCSNSGGLRDYLRLSFAHYDEATIREGIARIGAALTE